jgi:cyclophilin family peptidyl-prolyl cis-trans isomerase
LPFHTCLKDQYVQCGYWESSGYGSPAFIEDQEEVSFEQSIKKQEGILAFVTSKYPNTPKLQFAILLTDKPIYNEGIEMIFSPLGKVSDGLDLVKKLSNVDVDETLYPIIPQLVKRITVENNQNA